MALTQQQIDYFDSLNYDPERSVSLIGDQGIDLEEDFEPFEQPARVRPRPSALVTRPFTEAAERASVGFSQSTREDGAMEKFRAAGQQFKSGASRIGSGLSRIKEGVGFVGDVLTEGPSALTEKRGKAISIPLGALDVAGGSFQSIFGPMLKTIGAIPFVGEPIEATATAVGGGLGGLFGGSVLGLGEATGINLEADTPEARAIHAAAEATEFLPLAAILPKKGNRAISQKGDKVISATIDQHIRPSRRKKTPKDLQRIKDLESQAIKDIYYNKDLLSFVDEFGENVQGKLPESLSELAEAQSGRLSDLFEQVATEVNKASDQGLQVDMGGVVRNALDNMEDSIKFIDIDKPEMVQPLLEKLSRWEGLGEVSPGFLDAMIREFNKSLQNYRQNPGTAQLSDVVVDAHLVHFMRQALYESIDGVKGDAFKQARTTMAAHKSLEEGLTKAVERAASKRGAGVLSMPDVPAAGNLLAGLIVQNPTMLVQSTGQIAFRLSQSKLFRDSDAAIRRMFKKLDIDTGVKRSKIGSGLRGAGAAGSIETILDD